MENSFSIKTGRGMMGGRVEYLGLGLLGANSAFSLLLQCFFLFSPCVRSPSSLAARVVAAGKAGKGKDTDPRVSHGLRDLAVSPDLRILKSCEFPCNCPRFSKLFPKPPPAASSDH